MTAAILVFVTCPTLAEARALARALVEGGLVACASVGTPVQSLYRWQGKLEDTSEYPITLKTRRELFPALEAEVRRLHSYATPEIVAVPVVAASEGYLAWLVESVGGEGAGGAPLGAGPG